MPAPHNPAPSYSGTLSVQERLQQALSLHNSQSSNDRASSVPASPPVTSLELSPDFCSFNAIPDPAASPSTASSAINNGGRNSQFDYLLSARIDGEVDKVGVNPAPTPPLLKPAPKNPPEAAVAKSMPMLSNAPPTAVVALLYPSDDQQMAAAPTIPVDDEVDRQFEEADGSGEARKPKGSVSQRSPA